MTEIYINGIRADIEEQSFNLTLQVNDFFDLKTRQSSFSENIKLPLTSKNLKIFELAGTHTHNSNIPYQKNFVDYYVGGIPVALNAFGVLKNTDSEYNFHFYDGNIDLYKAIEKLKLNDLPLDDFTHQKTIDGVKNTWNNDLDYVYAVADYGGQPEHDNGINIDFLIPSISAQWIWDEIFNITGFQYQLDPNILQGKYITISNAYKDVGADGTFDAVVDESEIIEFGSNTFNRHINKYVANLKITEDNTPLMTNGVIFTAANDGAYDIRMNITRLFPRVVLPWKLDVIPQLAITIEPNLTSSNIRSVISGSERTIPLNPSEPNVNYEGWGGEFIWRNIELNAGDKLSIVAIADEPFATNYQETQWGIDNFIDEPIQTKIIYKPTIEVSIVEYLSDISIKDLFSEILIQNALTPIIDKNGAYRFYTLDDRLNAPIIDWSDKFSRLLNESYVIGNYGQNNRFTYKYNNEGDDHNDGNFEINNIQLKDENIIDSKFYGAEREPTLFQSINKLLPEFKLWDEDVKEDGITYKELKNHYHWIEVKDEIRSVKLTSKGFGTTGQNNKFKYADFERFKWQNLINENYSNLGDILSRMASVEVEVNLSELEIYNFDFFCRIYIKELSGVFIPNKINYKPKQLTTVELIKIA